MTRPMTTNTAETTAQLREARLPMSQLRKIWVTIVPYLMTHASQHQ